MFLGSGFAWVGYRNQLALMGVSTRVLFAQLESLPVEFFPQTLALYPHAPPSLQAQTCHTYQCLLFKLCVLIPSVFSNLFINPSL